jgi:hypothetical protein
VDVLKEAVVAPPVQLYEAIDLPAQAVALAETVRLGLVQVIGPLLVAVTEGRQVSTTAEQELEAVQPLD